MTSRRIPSLPSTPHALLFLVHVHVCVSSYCTGHRISTCLLCKVGTWYVYAVCTYRGPESLALMAAGPPRPMANNGVDNYNTNSRRPFAALF